MSMRLILSAAAAVILVFLAFMTCSGQNAVPSTVKKTLLGGKVEILIPETFAVMNEDMLKLKYPAGNRPSLVYTNERGTINVAFSPTLSEASQKDIPEIKNTFMNMYKALFKTATLYSNGVDTINGRKIGYLEFLTPGIDTKIYNRVFFTDCDGKLLLCTFNCMENQMKDWAPVGKKIMSSLSVKWPYARDIHESQAASLKPRLISDHMSHTSLGLNAERLHGTFRGLSAGGLVSGMVLSFFMKVQPDEPLPALDPIEQPGESEKWDRYEDSCSQLSLPAVALNLKGSVRKCISPPF